MRRLFTPCLLLVLGIVLSSSAWGQSTPHKIVHDAEYYILAAQNGERWAAEDKRLDAKLAALRKKYGRPPNIIHIMWDDTAFGDVGIPAIQQVRGLRTPNLNRLAEEGILFTRMYTEPDKSSLLDPEILFYVFYDNS